MGGLTGLQLKATKAPGEPRANTKGALSGGDVDEEEEYRGLDADVMFPSGDATNDNSSSTPKSSKKRKKKFRYETAAERKAKTQKERQRKMSRREGASRR